MLYNPDKCPHCGMRLYRDQHGELNCLAHGSMPCGPITIEEAATILDIAKHSVYNRLHRHGICPFPSKQRAVLIFWEDLERIRYPCPYVGITPDPDRKVKVASPLVVETTGITRQAISKDVKTKFISGFVMSSRPWVDKQDFEGKTGRIIPGPVTSDAIAIGRAPSGPTGPCGP